MAIINFDNINKTQKIILNEISDYIKEVDYNDVDLEIDESNNTITIPTVIESFGEKFVNPGYSFFKNIKGIIKEPFSIAFTTEEDDEWKIHFLLYDGEQYWLVRTDDVDDILDWMEEEIEDEDEEEERDRVLANTNSGSIYDEYFPPIKVYQNWGILKL